MTDYRIGKCRWCEEHTDIYRGLCDDCSSHTVYCRICRRRVGDDSRCRHVFQDKWFEWSGSGTGWEPTRSVKSAFFDLLTLMPGGFAADLRAAIKGGKFHTWMVAPMIGGGGHLSLYGMPIDKEYGDDIIALGERADAERVGDGYHWIASLYERDTAKANRLTIVWIDEWSRNQVPHVGAWFWHQPPSVGASTINKGE